MRFLKEYSSCLFAAIVFIAALVVIFPFYQYYIDPDATAYLTVAKRYAAGDYHRAINGYWSPWAIWLTALLMKAGIASFKAAIIVNAAGALGFLFVSHSLMLLFRMRNDFRWLVNAALSIFLLYAVFWQSFDDLWECFFLLAVLRVMLKDNFISRPSLWVLAGFLGALAYLAKAYAFPFFILEVACCTFLMDRLQAAGKKNWRKVSAVCIITMLVFSSPWIYLLHDKYGIWTTGTAGPLNTSWYLVGHPYWKDGIGSLLPPVYDDSPSYWEDAWYVNGDTPHFWSSPKLFLLQIVKAGYNLLKFMQSINELTAFFIVAIVAAVIIIFSKRSVEQSYIKLKVLSLSFLLFPLGYVLVNFQGRYLWYMLPLCIVIIGCALQSSNRFNQLTVFMQRVAVVVFAFSIIAWPLWGLKDLLNKGKAEYLTAQALRKQGIQGSFATNIPYGPKTQDIVRLSYFSGNSYYNMPVPASKDDLLRDISRYRVKYYFHFYDGKWDEFAFSDEMGKTYPEVTGGEILGLKVFIIN